MEVKEIIPTGRFNKVQLELLKMFAKDIPEEDWEAIRDFAQQYFLAKATKEMDKLFEEKGWGDEKIEEWSKAHYRTPYTPK
jgi:hypothetical protein